VAVRLFVGNLPYGATEADLRAYVATVAPPLSVALPVDRETGRPRGFAFVEYAELAVAAEVIRRLNGQPFQGRPLSVSEARPREERGPGYRPSGPPSMPMGGPPASGGEPGGRRERNFGPPAPPKGRRTPSRPRGDAGPKGPIRVRGGGRVFDVDDEPGAEAAVEFDDVATAAPDEVEKDQE
jgi:cold-inducible RNA-binding protein